MKKSATAKINTRSSLKQFETKISNVNGQEKPSLAGKAYVPALESRRSTANNSKVFGNSTYRNTYYNSLGVRY